MNNKITCKQVQAILPFYLKGRVNPALTEIIEEHLAQCPECKELYLRAIENNEDYSYISSTIDEEENFEDKFNTKEYTEFKQKLSAYLDSELENKENIRIKKLTISNPLARKDLEDMYLFKRLLHSSFERTKDSCKFDFSKNIIKRLNENNIPQADYLMKLAVFLLCISALLSITLWTTG